jgi:hypothetical protein
MISHQDQREFMSLPCLPELLHQLKATHDGHHAIDQNNIRREILRGLKAFVPVFRRQNFVSLIFYITGQFIPDRFFIIDYEN